jgi:hypothetical protein
MTVRGFDDASLPANNSEASIAFYKWLGFTILYEDEGRAGEVR